MVPVSGVTCNSRVAALALTVIGVLPVSSRLSGDMQT
jgi:hypothetical protein